uniref:Uncharacterized protein n=1 Tax=Trichobilharzia regenti TaxID=157069 RepID=A0AA85JJ19_TRIRE|nr:unnamed protein product [Trichobilharzia regenti]
MLRKIPYFKKTRILFCLLCMCVYTLLSSLIYLNNLNSLQIFNGVDLHTLKQNHLQNSKCSIPQMDLWPKQKDYKHRNEITLPVCKQTELFKSYSLVINKTLPIHEFISFHKGKLRIFQSNISLNNSHSPIICSLFPIKRLNDYQSIFLNAVEHIYHGYQSDWPMFMVLCQPKENILTSGLHFSWNNNNVRFNQLERLFICGSYPPIVKQEKTPTELPPSSDSIDSISRLSAYRYFVKTMKFLQEINESATTMNIYNVIGDGTTVNLLGLLTGQLESELPESRKSYMKLNKNITNLKRDDNSTVLDSYPWIWREFSEFGNYVTHYIEDTPKWGTFQHRLCGFGALHTPTTSYGRPCLVAASQEEQYSGKILGCTMSRYTHQVLLESLTEFFSTYSHRPRFSLTFLSELIHENPAYGKLLDEDIEKLIKRIYYEDEEANNSTEHRPYSSEYPFANTLVILFSDHGPRMGDARLSVQGKLEERLPFMSIILPKRLREKWPEKSANIKHNQNRLVTLFDVHATLRDALINQLKWNNNNYNSGNNDYVSELIKKIHLKWKINPTRGLSLFNRIPIKRNCDDAYISSHWCVCLNWIPVLKDFSSSIIFSNPLIFKSTNAIINEINGIILKYKPHTTKNGQCSMINLYQIKSVEQAFLPKDMIRFIRSQDEDGRIPMFQEQYYSYWSPIYWLNQLNIFTGNSGENAGSIGNNNNNNNNAFIPGSILLRIHIIVKPEYAHFEATVKVNTTEENSLQAFSVLDISRIDIYEKYNWCLLDNELAEIKKYCICKK